MEENRLRATDLGYSLFAIICGSALGGYFLCYLAGKNWELQWEHWLMLCGVLYIILLGLHRLSHPVFLTRDGVESYSFGRLRRQIGRTEIAQIALIDPGFWASGSRGVNRYRLVFVPKGCHLCSMEFRGNKYLRSVRRQIICTDHTEKNLAFVRKHYGEIEDFTEYKISFKRRKK